MSQEATTLEQWAAQHERPDAPCMVALGRPWTPKEIAQEVMNNTEFGVQLRNSFFRNGVATILLGNQETKN